MVLCLLHPQFLMSSIGCFCSAMIHGGKWLPGIIGTDGNWGTDIKPLDADVNCRLPFHSPQYLAMEEALSPQVQWTVLPVSVAARTHGEVVGGRGVSMSLLFCFHGNVAVMSRSRGRKGIELRAGFDEVSLLLPVFDSSFLISTCHLHAHSQSASCACITLLSPPFCQSSGVWISPS